MDGSTTQRGAGRRVPLNRPRSEAVDEIMGTPSSLLVRYGNLFLLVVAIISLFFVSRLTYPDVVTSKLTLTTVNPAERLSAPRDVTIDRILINSGDTVAGGAVLMVFRSLAEFEHVLFLEDKLLEVRNGSDSLIASLELPNSLELGEIQENLYAFEEQREAYLTIRDQRLSGLSSQELQRRIQQQQRALNSEKLQKQALEQELLIATRQLETQRNLLNNNIIDETELRDAEQNELRARRLLRSSESRLRDYQFNIDLMRNQVTSYKSNEANQVEVKSKDLWESFNLLNRAVANWKQENLLMVVDGGKVVIDIDVREQKRFTKDAILATLLPLNPEGVLGRIDLEAQGSGKVKVGQQVIIKFLNFPYEEFGVVEGVVEQKSPISGGETIPILVALPNGMVTNTGNQLDPIPFMRGDAEIIVGNKRFFSWILDKEE